MRKKKLRRAPELGMPLTWERLGTEAVSSGRGIDGFKIDLLSPLICESVHEELALV